MADFEVLAPGGHQHLIDRIEERLDLKADASILEEVNEINRNQTKSTITGELLVASDSYAEPPLSLTVDGRSTQVTTTGRNLLDPSTLINGYITSSGDATGSTDTYKHTDYMPVTAGETYRVSQGGTTFSAIYTAFYDESKGFLSAKTQNSYTAPTYLAPEGAAFMRSSFNGAQAAYAMVEVNSGSSWGGFEPYTGGKPSPNPDYPQPIVSVDELALAFAGKNLLPNARTGRSSYNPEAGTTFNPTSSAPSGTITDNGDGTFIMTALSGWAGATLYTEPLPSGTYHIKAAFSGSTPRVSIGTVRARDMTFVGTPTNFTSSDSINKTYTFGEPHIITVYVGSSSAGTVTITQPQLELGSTATAYEPYEGTTVPIDLQDNVLRSLPDGTKDTLSLTYLRPSTREGWAWYTRELVQAVGHIADMGGLTWSYSSTYEMFYATPNDIRVDNSEQTVLMCSGYAGYANTTVNNLKNNMPDKSLAQRRGYATVYVKDSDYSDVTAFATSLNGVTLIYPLATPITTTLDPIELPVLPAPNCTVWADPTTGLQMEYVRDTNLTIQQINADIDGAYAAVDKVCAAIATVETSTARYNHAVGSYLMLDGVLYKVVSAIAAGEAIVPNTNVTATTVMAELAALL